LEYLRAKKEELLRQVVAVTGKGGKLRSSKTDEDRLRDRIRKSLSRAYCILREANPSLSSLADHLEAFIQPTGDGFIYNPTPALDWRTRF